MTGNTTPNLLRSFGRDLFQHLAGSYPDVISHAHDAFALITTIDDQIHVEVRKLYPDADLPSFSTRLLGVNEMELTYRSDRGLADLAEGLLEGCFAHYGETADVNKKDVSDGSAKEVIFCIQRRRDTDG